VARFRVAVVALFAKGSGGECAVVSRQAAGRGLLRVVYGRLDALKQAAYVAARKLPPGSWTSGLTSLGVAMSCL
jgi:hypothetical protein